VGIGEQKTQPLLLPKGEQGTEQEANKKLNTSPDYSFGITKEAVIHVNISVTKKEGGVL